MTLEAQIADINKLVAEQTAEYSKLTQDITEGLSEIDTVAQDMAATHALIKGNHQAINDWQTKTGKVTLKDLNGQSYQVDTLPSLINESQKINPHPEVMTKAQFDALCQMRKQQFAGSGFVEWGKHNSGHPNINEGLWQYVTEGYKNTLTLGERAENTYTGSSRSLSPVVVIDGVQHVVAYVGRPNTQNRPIFPPAPDGTKTYDAATGILTQHNSPIDAFNEKKNQTPNNAHSGTYDVQAGVFNVVQDAAGGIYFANKTSTHTHQVDIKFTSSVDTVVEFKDASGTVGDAPLIRTLNVTANKVQTVSISHEFANTGVYLRLPVPQIGQKITIHGWQTRPQSENVVTSRKDLVFLESWHEKISDKDVVYPLGNVQYGASSYEGVTLANSLVAQGYSAFGQWDTNTKGYGVKWSTLSDANRIKFLKNPEHNIYYDPEAKAYIQVRYRMRVIEGHGDNWYGPTATQGSGYLDFSPREHIRPQGMRVETASDWRMGYPLFANGTFSTARYPMEHQDVGLYGAVAAQNVKDVNSGHEGLCFATPIALVQRLNQGAYHPTYNPMGCGNFTRPDGWGITRWYNPKFANIEPTSPLECFTLDYGNPNHMAGAPAHGSWKKFGSIAGSDANSGRRDQYKFYDAIYAGQVEDLRLNANKLDINQLRDEAMRKAVAGTLRGKERTIFTTVEAKKLAIASAYAGKYYVNFSETVDIQNGYEIEPQNRPFSYLYNSTRGNTLYPTYVEPNGNIYTSDAPVALSGNRFQDIESSTLLDWQIGDDIYLINGEQMTSEFDSLPWIDIIGYPERIAQTFPDGVMGQWVPQLPNGGSQDFKLNRKASQPLTWAMSLDDGSSWNSGSLAINSTKNAYVSPAEAARVQLIYYRADAGFTATAVNSQVLDSVGDVWLGNDARSNFGARLQQSLTSSIATTVSYTSNTYVPLAARNLLDDKLIKDEFPQHLVPPALGGEKGAYACKVLPTITNYRGLLYMQFHGAQLQLDTITPTLVLGSDKVEQIDDKAYVKIATQHMQGVYQKVRNFGTASYDSYLQAGDLVADQHGNMISVATGLVYYRKVTMSNWGDDQTIPVIDNENVKTDLNGNKVKVFCHHTLLPLGIASH
ncbi:hypothetical protein [Pseudoalteromonas sp. MMG022]|uniref:hypothetical protein n=1 Tax=Pseudoalteromonas sp. MMG022 TaxID=2909978 RepID=UPI001F192C52|nr:hypothetical protein [Pseudoalteromonas sp. MMG022]MCF6435226.1 hypothetical protein [Pseudoalteromonas sp. MMG022]